MSYRGMGLLIDEPGSRAYKQYWNARAQQCKMFADEGSCLARVARHVPVTIGGFGDVPRPGSNLGPDHPVPPSGVGFLRKLLLTWGAWPTDQAGFNPMYLAANSPNEPTISTGEALVSLKTQVVVAGVAGLAVGWLLHRRPKAAVQTNRRRRRR